VNELHEFCLSFRAILLFISVSHEGTEGKEGNEVALWTANPRRATKFNLLKCMTSIRAPRSFLVTFIPLVAFV
jgi:hypothetical protein